ncbi:MAG: SIMPL domain-containing protein [Muribaculaceae bacterium]|nr:SIMPL domain-containing protein [Muribaculaceae bacterium]
MKKTFLIALMLSAFIPSLVAQNTILVSGKAELSIVPDEVHLLLTEKEYHQIDFKGKIFVDYGDYSSNIVFDQSLFDSTLPDAKFQFKVGDKVYEGKKKDIKYTLVDIATLEDRVIRAADKAGLSKDDINISELGDYWRWRNAPYLVSKQYDIKLTEPAQLTKFISALDKQGVALMSFGEMKNKEMDQYDRKGRVQALGDAREKAAYMVQTYNGTLGEPQQIVDGNMPVMTTVVQPRMLKSAAMMNDMVTEEAMDAGGASLESLNTFPLIKKTYNVSVIFTAIYK